VSKLEQTPSVAVQPAARLGADAGLEYVRALWWSDRDNPR